MYVYSVQIVHNIFFLQRVPFKTLKHSKPNLTLIVVFKQVHHQFIVVQNVGNKIYKYSIV